MKIVKSRLELAIKILLGYVIVVYEKETNLVNLMLDGHSIYTDGIHIFTLEKKKCVKTVMNENDYSLYTVIEKQF